MFRYNIRAPIDLYAPEQLKSSRAPRGDAASSFPRLPTGDFFLFCFSLAPIIIVIIYSPQFFEMRNKHVKYIYEHTHTHTGKRAINMKYCLIEDIVLLKTLPRAFFPRFFFFFIIIIRYLFIIFRAPPPRSYFHEALFNRLHFEPSNPPVREEEEKNNNNKRK